MLLNVSMFVYVLLLARIYVRMFVCVLACIFIYLHIFLLSVGGKEWDKGRECKKRRISEGGGNGLLQSEFLLLSNFMVVKGLFWFEYEKSVLWGILLSDNDDDD